MKNKLSHAQFFTPDSVALLMADLSKNAGRFLEPSCGQGVLVSYLYNDSIRNQYVAIELDKTVAPEYAKVMDFFEFDLNQTFGTVIGNPPYLSYQNIPESTQKLPLFQQVKSKLGGLSNLYAAFILKSFLHLEPNGELIMIVPEELFRTSSNFKLFDFLHKHGTFTDVIYFKKSPFLPEVSQPVLIFRYEKDNFSYLTEVKTI